MKSTVCLLALLMGCLGTSALYGQWEGGVSVEYETFMPADAFFPLQYDASSRTNTSFRPSLYLRRSLSDDRVLGLSAYLSDRVRLFRDPALDQQVQQVEGFYGVRVDYGQVVFAGEGLRAFWNAGLYYNRVVRRAFYYQPGSPPLPSSYFELEGVGYGKMGLANEVEWAMRARNAWMGIFLRLEMDLIVGDNRPRENRYLAFCLGLRASLFHLSGD